MRQLLGFCWQLRIAALTDQMKGKKADLPHSVVGVICSGHLPEILPKKMLGRAVKMNLSMVFRTINLEIGRPVKRAVKAWQKMFPSVNEFNRLDHLSRLTTE